MKVAKRARIDAADVDPEGATADVTASIFPHSDAQLVRVRQVLDSRRGGAESEGDAVAGPLSVHVTKGNAVQLTVYLCGLLASRAGRPVDVAGEVQLHADAGIDAGALRDLAALVATTLAAPCYEIFSDAAPPMASLPRGERCGERCIVAANAARTRFEHRGRSPCDRAAVLAGLAGAGTHDVIGMAIVTRSLDDDVPFLTVLIDWALVNKKHPEFVAALLGGSEWFYGYEDVAEYIREARDDAAAAAAEEAEEADEADADDADDADDDEAYVADYGMRLSAPDVGECGDPDHGRLGQQITWHGLPQVLEPRGSVQPYSSLSAAVCDLFLAGKSDDVELAFPLRVGDVEWVDHLAIAVNGCAPRGDRKTIRMIVPASDQPLFERDQGIALW